MQEGAEPGSVEQFIDDMSAKPDVPPVQAVIPEDPVNRTVDEAGVDQAGSGHVDLTVPLHDELRARAEQRGARTEGTEIIIAEEAIRQGFSALPSKRQLEIIREQRGRLQP